jgi:hypothetical protein
MSDRFVFWLGIVAIGAGLAFVTWLALQALW